MAPPMRRRKRALPAVGLGAAAAPPVIDPADRLSRLPDEILAQILSFLPAQEAVRTCVLARTWRDVWKFTRCLRLTGTVREVGKFVARLLHLRLNGLKCASLEECEITFDMHGGYNTHGTVDRWIYTSLKCQVQALRVLNKYEVPGLNDYLEMARPFCSPHLTRLELRGALLRFACLYLDDCPALEHLEIRSCLLGVSKITSPSLKRLVITECYSDENRLPFKRRRLQISAPCLVSLWLEVGAFRAPLLASMPELLEAYVKIDSYEDNNCSCDDPMGCYHVMSTGLISDDDSSSEDTEDYHGPNTEVCTLLEGLAQAKHLLLLAHPSTYIFRRDLRFCPTFSNLKALVLNGYWCEPEDCYALACILEHAPVLEKLTILFSEKVELKYDIVFEGRPDTTAKSTMKTQCLETIKVKWNIIHKGVQNVLNYFVGTLNICFNSECQAPHEDETIIT